MKRTLALLLAACSLSAALPIAAQQSGSNPTFGNLTLSAGFRPDPQNVAVLAGGLNDARSIGTPCTGYISRAMDVRLNYRSGSLPLYISATSGSDTTLVVRAPDGLFYCDDDTGSDLNPKVTFLKPMSGTYEIWIGTYAPVENNNFSAATLHVSELSGS